MKDMEHLRLEQALKDVTADRDRLVEVVHRLQSERSEAPQIIPEAFLDVARRMADANRPDDEVVEVTTRMTKDEVAAMRAGGGFGALVKDDGDNRHVFSMDGLTVGDWRKLL